MEIQRQLTSRHVPVWTITLHVALVAASAVVVVIASFGSIGRTAVCSTARPYQWRQKHVVHLIIGKACPHGDPLVQCHMRVANSSGSGYRICREQLAGSMWLLRCWGMMKDGRHGGGGPASGSIAQVSAGCTAPIWHNIVFWMVVVLWLLCHGCCILIIVFLAIVAVVF